MKGDVYMKQSFLKSPKEYEDIDFIALDMVIFCSFIVFLAVYIFNVTI